MHYIPNQTDSWEQCCFTNLNLKIMKLKALWQQYYKIKKVSCLMIRYILWTTSVLLIVVVLSLHTILLEQWLTSKPAPRNNRNALRYLLRNLNLISLDHAYTQSWNPWVFGIIMYECWVWISYYNTRISTQFLTEIFTLENYVYISLLTKYLIEHTQSLSLNASSQTSR